MRPWQAKIEAAAKMCDATSALQPVDLYKLYKGLGRGHSLLLKTWG